MAAPIALFSYRRYKHLQTTLEALLRNPEADETDLHVFSDGARDEASAAEVDEVRRVLRQLNGFKSITIVEHEKNVGLARNIIGGVSDVLARSDRVIVIEDDIVVSPVFLRFMNEALSLYQTEPRVGSISGYCYPIGRSVAETFFV